MIRSNFRRYLLMTSSRLAIRRADLCRLCVARGDMRPALFNVRS